MAWYNGATSPAGALTLSGSERAAKSHQSPGVPGAAEDAALLHLLREQPHAAAAALYDRYGALVFSVALRVVGDRGAAEEVTQDVFVSVWRNAARYSPAQGSLATWLLAITHNRAIDELRSRRQRARTREVSQDLPGLQGATPGPDSDTRLLQAEVRAALAGLPAAQREVIELLYFGGLTRREAAERLQAPLGTVHTRLRLGMARLRAALDALFSDGSAE